MGPLTPTTIRRFFGRCIDLCVPGDARPAVSFVEIADNLRRVGVGEGDFVVVALPNGKSLLNHYFALLSLGAAPGLIPPGTPSHRTSRPLVRPDRPVNWGLDFDSRFRHDGRRGVRGVVVFSLVLSARQRAWPERL